MSPLALLRSAAAGRRARRSSASSRPLRQGTRTPPRGVLHVEVSGLPDECAAHFSVRTADGRTVLEGEARCGDAPTDANLPLGDYRLRWQPTLAMIEGRAHTFVPTILERDVRVSPDGAEADGSGTYVCLGSVG